MESRYRIHPKAANDIADIVRYLEERSESASQIFLDDVWEPVEFLALTPGAGSVRGKGGRFQSLRSWSLKYFDSHLVFFVPIDPRGIYVLRVVHGSRDLSRVQFPNF